MTFKESITSVYFKNYANFEGKASRSELWWATLFYLIVSFVGAFFIGLIMGMSGIISEEEMLNRTAQLTNCLLYTSPSPRDQRGSRMPSSA